MLDAALKAEIEKDIRENKVLLYMKGTPAMPQCGFSAQVVAILNKLGVSFASRNIFEREDLRQGMKEFSDWPTFPQLYINGEFIGGCDIVTELAGSGELQQLLKA
jgi:monothiol glutaredoxin